MTTLVVEHLWNEHERTVFAIRYQLEKNDGTVLRIAALDIADVLHRLDLAGHYQPSYG